MGTIPSSISYAGYAFIPTKLASNWFGKNEIGRATSICIGKDT